VDRGLSVFAMQDGKTACLAQEDRLLLARYCDRLSGGVESILGELPSPQVDDRSTLAAHATGVFGGVRIGAQHHEDTESCVSMVLMEG
jgi:hypothetical protein